MWKIIKSLKGCPDINSPNEAMLHKGKSIVSNKKKTQIFLQHYASVNRHYFNMEERTTNRKWKKMMRNRKNKLNN